MVLLKSEDFVPGTSAPDFKLKSVDQKEYSLGSFSEAKALVILFICNHCPYVQAIEDRLIQLNRDYADRGVQLVGICSNDPTDYPEDRPEKLLERWRQKDYNFPYLVDETQEVAKAFKAVCTPDIFVYDQSKKLAYHGRLDDSWKDPAQVIRQELREALDLILAGKTVSEDQNPSMGCSIKWKE